MGGPAPGRLAASTGGDAVGGRSPNRRTVMRPVAQGMRRLPPEQKAAGSEGHHDLFELQGLILQPASRLAMFDTASAPQPDIARVWGFYEAVILHPLSYGIDGKTIMIVPRRLAHLSLL